MYVVYLLQDNVGTVQQQIVKKKQKQKKQKKHPECNNCSSSSVSFDKK